MDRPSLLTPTGRWGRGGERTRPSRSSRGVRRLEAVLQMAVVAERFVLRAAATAEEDLLLAGDVDLLARRIDQRQLREIAPDHDRSVGREQHFDGHGRLPGSDLLRLDELQDELVGLSADRRLEDVD